MPGDTESRSSSRLTRARLVLAGFGWRVFLKRYRLPLLAGLLLVGLLAVAVAVLTTSGSSNSSPAVPAQPYAAPLAAVPLNHVTGSGNATITLRGYTATVTLDTNGLLAGSPHLAHIHGLGLGTCPTAVNARRHNGHLTISTGDAIRLYGSTLVSFTEWGSTSGAVPTNIDLNRYPASGRIRYKRTMTVPRLVADLIRDGDAVIVVHGIDYNYNHVYDFNALGVSDLDKTLPGEATAPALCGPLRRAPGTRTASVEGPTTFVASLKPEPAAASSLPSATTSASEAASPAWSGDYGSRPNELSLLCHLGGAWAPWS
jgi:hypothetical protein